MPKKRTIIIDATKLQEKDLANLPRTLAFLFPLTGNHRLPQKISLADLFRATKAAQEQVDEKILKPLCEICALPDEIILNTKRARALAEDLPKKDILEAQRMENYVRLKQFSVGFIPSLLNDTKGSVDQVFGDLTRMHPHAKLILHHQETKSAVVFKNFQGAAADEKINAKFVELFPGLVNKYFNGNQLIQEIVLKKMHQGYFISLLYPLCEMLQAVCGDQVATIFPQTMIFENRPTEAILQLTYPIKDKSNINNHSPVSYTLVFKVVDRDIWLSAIKLDITEGTDSFTTSLNKFGFNLNDLSSSSLKLDRVIYQIQDTVDEKVDDDQILLFQQQESGIVFRQLNPTCSYVVNFKDHILTYDFDFKNSILNRDLQRLLKSDVASCFEKLFQIAFFPNINFESRDFTKYAKEVITIANRNIEISNLQQEAVQILLNIIFRDSSDGIHKVIYEALEKCPEKNAALISLCVNLRTNEVFAHMLTMALKRFMDIRDWEGQVSNYLVFKRVDLEPGRWLNEIQLGLKKNKNILETQRAVLNSEILPFLSCFKFGKLSEYTQRGVLLLGMNPYEPLTMIFETMVNWWLNGYDVSNRLWHTKDFKLSASNALKLYKCLTDASSEIIELYPKFAVAADFNPKVVSEQVIPIVNLKQIPNPSEIKESKDTKEEKIVAKLLPKQITHPQPKSLPRQDLLASSAPKIIPVSSSHASDLKGKLLLLLVKSGVIKCMAKIFHIVFLPNDKNDDFDYQPAAVRILLDIALRNPSDGVHKSIYERMEQSAENNITLGTMILYLTRLRCSDLFPYMLRLAAISDLDDSNDCFVRLGSYIRNNHDLGPFLILKKDGLNKKENKDVLKKQVHVLEKEIKPFLFFFTLGKNAKFPEYWANLLCVFWGSWFPLIGSEVLSWVEECGYKKPLYDSKKFTQQQFVSEVLKSYRCNDNVCDAIIELQAELSGKTNLSSSAASSTSSVSLPESQQSQSQSSSKVTETKETKEGKETKESKTNSASSSQSSSSQAALLSRQSIITAQTETRNGKEISKVYWYEDSEMRRTLELELKAHDNHAADGKRVSLLGPLDHNYGITQALTSYGKPPGIALIPYNLYSMHWVGIILEYNESKQLVRADYYDPQERAVPQSLNSELKLLCDNSAKITEFTAVKPTHGLIKQTNGSDCGPCTIENLLGNIGYRETKDTDAIGRRLRNLTTLGNGDQKFYNDFYQRQRENRSSFSQLSGVCHAELNKYNFTKTEYQWLLNLALDIAELPNAIKQPLVTALQPSAVREAEEHASHLDRIRTVLNTELTNSTVRKIIAKLFVINSETTSLAQTPLRIDYNQLEPLGALVALPTAAIQEDLATLAQDNSMTASASTSSTNSSSSTTLSSSAATSTFSASAIAIPKS